MPKQEKAIGREAKWPSAIPWRGWRRIIARVWHRAFNDHVSTVAAGAAFFALIGIAPGVAFLISVAGLLLDPSDLIEQLAAITVLLPQDAADILIDQAVDVAGDDTRAGYSAVAFLIFSLWSMGAATKTLIEGMNIVYEEDERRGFARYNATAFGLAILMSAGAITGVVAVIVAPYVENALGLGYGMRDIVSFGRWPFLICLSMVVLAALYRFGPCRRSAKWRWVSWGAIAAGLLWLLASLLFSLYVTNFARYNETYGTLAGVVVLLTWLWISCLAVLLGALLDAEVEHQTAEDSTVGPDRPMGSRGAVKADSLPVD